MTRREAIQHLEALAIHADMIAFSYREMARHSTALHFESIVRRLDERAPVTFTKIADECRKQAEALG